MAPGGERHAAEAELLDEGLGLDSEGLYKRLKQVCEVDGIIAETAPPIDLEEQMPRVTEIENDGGDPTLAEVFKKERDVFGGLLNTTKVLAHCPPILRAAKLLGAAIEQSALLPKGLTPLVYLRVASINGCPF